MYYVKKTLLSCFYILVIETDNKLKIKQIQVTSTINTRTISIVLEKYAMTFVEKKQGKALRR